MKRLFPYFLSVEDVNAWSRWLEDFTSCQVEPFVQRLTRKSWVVHHELIDACVESLGEVGDSRLSME